MKRNQGWKGMLLTAVLALSVLAIGCDDNDDKDTVKKNYTISGNANGTQVVPSVNGTGSGTMTGTYNPNTRVLSYTNGWSGLTGAPTSGGFYTGASGINGSAVGSPWTYDGNITGTGNYNGTMTLTEAQEQQLLGGNWYYGYNTATNTNGEVRGQITSTQVR
ncbi:MAG: CHRD domain-containing protein [Cyclobacteriaceae bacterium]|nr:CHRD domain-containing protein [Cyclobacteriaceae bacterium]